MDEPSLSITMGEKVIIQAQSLQNLFDALTVRGYELIGPTIRDSAIVYEEIDSVADMPAGWTDEQDGGTYRLTKRADAALFGYTVGPQSWKKYLHLPMRRLWQARRTSEGNTFEFVEEEQAVPRRAFIGVRACEIQAIGIQDRVFIQGPFTDPLYKALRDNAFIVAVNCSQAGGTCFCDSMNSGPQVTSGFDLSLTEILEADRHVFLVEAGSEAGLEVLQEIPCTPALDSDVQTAARIVQETASHMGRSMETYNIKNTLYASHEHPRWEEVASRCLSCTNCTVVCPTCFCLTVEDVTDLTGDHAERWQRWDSCFTLDFSYIHGGSVRASAAARYRQWLTHKLGSWIDQFGTSGCVGCGRCITWCPVGIDITEEVRALQDRKSTQTSAAEISTLNMV